MRPAVTERPPASESGHQSGAVAARSPYRAAVLVGLATLLGLWHVWVVSKRYFVGSFDDDANYIITAKALLDGQGLTGHLVSGATVVGAYPPGFSVLLVPLLWIWPHTFVPERLFSAVLSAAVLPLLWVWLGRLRLSDPIRFGTVVLLVLSPTYATYGSMVMAEMPFILLLIVLLLVAEPWQGDARVLGPRGIGVIVAGAGLIWLKEAGVALVIGVALWYLLRLDWRRALAVAVGTVVLLLPFLIARAVGHVALAGSRYSQEIGGYYSGGLLHRLFVVVPHSLGKYFSTALPATVIPSGSPLPQTGFWGSLLSLLAWQVGFFVVIGLAVAIWRHRDLAVVAIPVYVGETLLFPYINERRVILILPIIVAWYVLGVVTCFRWLLTVGAARVRTATDYLRAPVAWRSAVAAVLALAVIGYPLARQFPRDYHYNLGEDTSHPQGSRYMSILAALTPHSTVVETDYLNTTALFSGHQTGNTAFGDVIKAVAAGRCTVAAAQAGFAADHAGYLLLGNLDDPRAVDNGCLEAIASTPRPTTFAVQLLRTQDGDASVFELIGPGTAHPDLRDLVPTATTAASGPTRSVANVAQDRVDAPGTSTVVDPVGGRATLTWSWAPGTPLTQVSVGEARTTEGSGPVTAEASGHAVSAVTLQVEERPGRWTSVADAPGAVGDGGAPYLLAQLPAGTRAGGMRLVVDATAPVVVTDIHALGGEA
jgi:hypothetical protein